MSKFSVTGGLGDVTGHVVEVAHEVIGVLGPGVVWFKGRGLEGGLTSWGLEIISSPCMGGERMGGSLWAEHGWT